MRLKNQKDFWAGLMFVGFGAFFAGFGVHYNIGTAAKMGPGYFPTSLGVITILLGIITLAGGMSGKASAEKTEKFDLRTLFLILVSIVIFGLLLRPLGLIASLVMLVVISSYASHEFSWKATLVNAAVLIGVCLIIFIWGLKLQFQLWPSFIRI
jgi:hypothetical protein